MTTFCIVFYYSHLSTHKSISKKHDIWERGFAIIRFREYIYENINWHRVLTIQEPNPLGTHTLPAVGTVLAADLVTEGAGD
jgi:hypothetical protein